MPVANLNGLQVIVHEGEVLTNAEQWAAKLDAASELIATLQAQVLQQQQAGYMATERSDRSVDIENYLINASKGNRPLPNAEDCKVIALRLGTPRDHWTDYLVKYKYGSKKPVKE